MADGARPEGNATIVVLRKGQSVDSYVIRAFWDDEARVWVAESDDVPGLATGAPTLDELVSKLAVMIPELLELNHQFIRSQTPRFEVHAVKDHERLTVIRDAA